MKETVKTLAQWFDRRGLNTSPVFQPTKSEETNFNILFLLKVWVLKYLEIGSRAGMEAQGLTHPPIDPAFRPDTDWLCFERWCSGMPLSWSYTDVCGDLPLPEIDDEGLDETLKAIVDNLASKGISVVLQPKLPPRKVYEYLLGRCSEPFDLVGPKLQVWLDGCMGHCPSCFQRPWCEVGSIPDWPEDEE